MRSLRILPAALLAPALLLVLACGSSNNRSTTPPAAVTNTWVVPDSASALDPTARTALASGNLYVNAHTSANPAGEIRGQLDAVGTAKLASLDGAQETPATTSTGFGAGVLTVDAATGKARGFVVTSGLVAPNAAHVHSAGRGTQGAIILPLIGGPDVWIVPDDAAPLTAAQMADFVAGNLYFNVHTAANPGGEIRGQIDKAGTMRLASLNGAQETPANTSTAFGAGILAVDSAGKVAGFVQTSGLASSTAAHVHDAARGVPGGIIVPLTGGPGLWVVPDGAPSIGAGDLTAFGADGLYYNVHTAALPAGEIRGQLDKTGTPRVAALSGAQETPPVTTTAFGASIIAVDDGSGEISGLLVTSGLVSPTAAHVHSAARGVPGGILVPLTGP
jgi:hypothetical protein